MKIYATPSEVNAFISITPTELECEIASQYIDVFVGYHDRYFHVITDEVMGVSGAVITLKNRSQKGHFIYSLAETDSGVMRNVIDSIDFTVTLESAFVPQIEVGDILTFRQMRIFPRVEDVRYYEDRIIKYIPYEIKMATAFQVEYMREMGDDFFVSNKAGLQSERIGDYSYTKSTSSYAMDEQTAPKVKQLLKNYRRITGKIT